ncbi:unnamed protein product [Moneuplotes crassus]|uniref:Uncharacterized protein n=1 Tax=Euplotes crassus TaxID=5936 RepID=A0AAD2CXX4_EUPCR|nr:unnamed protein product [Moneuplotes crassus]
MELDFNFEEDQTNTNLDNYKGIHHDDPEQSQKYFDQETGAHFNYKEACSKLQIFKRRIEEKENKPILKLRNKKSKFTVIRIKPKKKISGLQEKYITSKAEQLQPLYPLHLKSNQGKLLFDQERKKSHTRPAVLSSLDHIQAFKKIKNISDLKPNYKEKIIRMKMAKGILKKEFSHLVKQNKTGSNKIMSTCQYLKKGSISDQKQTPLRTRDTSRSKSTQLEQMKTVNAFLMMKAKEKMLPKLCKKDSRNVKMLKKRSNFQSEFPKIKTRSSDSHLRDTNSHKSFLFF